MKPGVRSRKPGVRSRRRQQSAAANGPAPAVTIDRRLIEAFARRRVAIFVGAGVSVSAGHPTWQELISKLAMELGIEPDVGSEYSSGLLMRIPQYYENEFGVAALARAIDAGLGDGRPSAIHTRLAKLPCNLFYTTNFDELLEDALEDEEVDREVIVTDHDASVYGRSDSCQVRKIHGTISRPDTLVITRTHFARWERDHPGLHRKLATDFNDFTFLFIGYSMIDPDFNAVYDENFFDSLPYHDRHFILIGNTNEHERTDLKGRGLEPIMLEHLPGDDASQQTLAFLNYLEAEASEISHIGSYFRGIQRRGDGDLEIVVPSLLHETEGFVYRPLCDTYAKDQIREALHKLGAHPRILSDEEAMEAPEDVLSRNPILVGSPFGNRLTNFVFERAQTDDRIRRLVPDEFCESEEGRTLIDSRGERYFAPDPQGSDGITHQKEYALVARYSNPWAETDDEWFYLLAGLHAMGTAAIGDFLADLKNFRDLATRAATNEATLLELDYVSHNPYQYEYKLLDVHSLPGASDGTGS